MSPDVGMRLGHYELTGKLGAGGMGRVYRARDTRLGREVALKLLTETAVAESTAVERFRREALAASALNHPNIITIYELLDSAYGPVLAMELIDGKTLRELLSEGPQLQYATDWLRQLARALSVAHKFGIVHRDLKPDNIMVRRDGYVKILDFGVARLTAPKGDGETTVAGTSTGTTPGILIGTLRYMSPEQVRGEAASTPSDIFSIGLVWFELLTGKHPFAGDSLVATMHRINSADAVAPSQVHPEVPPHLDRVVLRMLHKQPQSRPTAEEIAAELSLPPADTLRTGTFLEQPVSRYDSTIGRQAELAALREAYLRTSRGGGQFLCIAGEAGIGKTTLAETFLVEIPRSANPALIARGRCSERLAGTEAYLPFLESLDDLLRKYPDMARPVMKQHAPMWYAQVAATTQQNTSLSASGADGRNVTPDRMKRELHLFLRELSAVNPVILFFDDLHWADPSTVDLVSHVASQFASMRLLMLATYRPSDMMVAKHPFLSVRLSLQAKGLLTELSPDLLSRDELERYLACLFPEHLFPSGFAAMLHARTEGHPLFVTDLLAYLRDQGVITAESGRWTLTKELSDVAGDLPVSVRSMVERKIDQLSDADRRLLAAASVQGYEFDSAVIAEVQGVDAADAEERLDVLDKVHSFVRVVNEDELPNRKLSVRYRFVHVLYQNALYASLRPTRRASLCAAVAASLEKHLNGKRDSKAAELAILYEAAREFDPAARYFLSAARNAGAKFAAGEAATLARRGLDAAKNLPDSESRLTLNLELEVALAFALRITRGNAARETGGSMLRARELAEQAGRSEYVPALLWGLWLYYQVGGDLATARHFGEQLLSLGTQTGDREVLLGAHTALGITAVHQGQIQRGHDHLENAVTFHDPLQHATYVARYNLDPGVYAGPGTQRTFWLLGYPDHARRRTAETLAWCDRFMDPQSVAFIHVFAAFFYQFVGEFAEAGRVAQICIGICDEHGIVQEREWVAPVYGWALAKRGRVAEGLDVLRSSLARHRAIQSQLNVPYYMTLLAEILLESNQIDDGLEVMEDALQVVEQTRQSSFEAEIYRLKGELLFAKNSGADTAVHFVERGVEIAQSQSARSLQLRAAVSLCRMLNGKAQEEQARAALRQIYDTFTEGLNTLDLIKAREALQ